jgi:hypothetical protein
VVEVDGEEHVVPAEEEILEGEDGAPGEGQLHPPLPLGGVKVLHQPVEVEPAVVHPGVEGIPQ